MHWCYKTSKSKSANYKQNGQNPRVQNPIDSKLAGAGTCTAFNSRMWHFLIIFTMILQGWISHIYFYIPHFNETKENTIFYLGLWCVGWFKTKIDKENLAIQIAFISRTLLVIYARVRAEAISFGILPRTGTWKLNVDYIRWCLVVQVFPSYCRLCSALQ